DGPAAPHEAAALVSTLARAIHHAHTRGILHLNMKPSNVLLGADGQPKVAGFGLACLRDSAKAAASARGRFGRLPSYLPPEQATPEPHNVSRATDIYGLGGILYFLLTGTPPFLADTLQATRELVLTQAPRPPHSLRRGVPTELEEICLRCLEKQPEKRFES